ncbi:hypothetical protein MRQ86_02440 [Streptomyces sp. MMS21 TC-5]|uniref:hypothetical protein n=1 Tax=Streptomyces sp. MMS21 TC-5 TaxID=2925833 RepID=UPI001F60200A|nr:hypothetical protein [Streptomyces sp. MMS21 TC-5]MCI4079224.1 hypothetical protein [Streptomyces sp. MMS21 TC-5]
MNSRVLRTELRRSVAPWAGIVILAAPLALLYLIPGMWWTGTARWTAQWTSMALWTRSLLILLWPVAVGLGALQGLRDHRSGIAELLASTPRPARHRAAAPAGATALTLTAAFALLVLVGAVHVLTDTGYAHLVWLPISLVGALSLAAGAVLGMGLGRAVPSLLTPPLLAVGALVFTNVLRVSDETAVPQAAVPNRLSLLSPAVAQVREVLFTLPASVHVGQTLWFLGLAATGFALLAATTPRARLIALAPVLAGAVLALLVLPSDPRRTYVVDEAAARQVCEGPVCVAKTHRARLAGLADPARKALGLLHEALGDGAPVVVHESTTPLALGATPERYDGVLFVDFDDETIAGARGEALTLALVAQGMAPVCRPRSSREGGPAVETAAQSIAAAWVLGDLQPLDGAGHSRDEQLALADPVWRELRALPRAEQRARIDAMRTAVSTCEGDPLDALAGGSGSP